MAQLFRSADGRSCAQVPVGDRLEIYGLRSAGFRDWLIDGVPDRSDRAAVELGHSPRDRHARGPGAVHAPAFPRSSSASARMATAPTPRISLTWAIPAAGPSRLDDQGWSVVDRPDVYFRRPEGLLPLPVPARDGSIDLLRPYVNLTEPDFRLMIAWLTAALRPVGPYPVLVLNGEQSSGKSTLARILRLLIDPQTCPVLALPEQHART